MSYSTTGNSTVHSGVPSHAHATGPAQMTSAAAAAAAAAVAVGTSSSANGMPTSPAYVPPMSPYQMVMPPQIIGYRMPSAPAGGAPGVGVDATAVQHMAAAVAGTPSQAVVPPQEDEPLYVNAKQYHRILKRRAVRARLEEQNRLAKQRKVGVLCGDGMDVSSATDCLLCRLGISR
jgi:hypothetical protein